MCVHFLPQCVAENELTESAAVVVDVLRATTTLTYALAAGASRVLPTVEVEEAQALAAEMPPGSYVLGGERGGKIIPGFDLGNSPAEYTPDRVAGRTIIFTTTNGTRAIAACVKARRVLLGSLVNLDCVARSLADEPRVDVVCAGTDGQVSRDDVMTAGAIVRLLEGTAERPRELNDEAMVARAVWEDALHHDPTLERELSKSRGGRNLRSAGMRSDLPWAIRLNAISLIGECTWEKGRPVIRAVRTANPD